MKVPRLQEEIRQRTPFASKRQEAMLAVMRTADGVRRRVAMLLEGYGVTPQQYNVLRILRGAGEQGLPTLAIVERLIEQTPGVTRLLDRMESRQWVERVRCEVDRRVVYAKITEDGLALLSRIDLPIQEMQETLFPMLSGEEVDTLIELLARARVDGAGPDADSAG